MKAAFRAATRSTTGRAGRSRVTRLGAAWAPAVVAVAIALLAALAALGGVGESSVRTASDLLWTDGTADPRVVGVAVDEASVAELGEWPWNDDLEATLLRTISSADPAVVAVPIASVTRPRGRRSW